MRSWPTGPPVTEKNVSAMRHAALSCGGFCRRCARIEPGGSMVVVLRISFEASVNAAVCGGGETTGGRGERTVVATTTFARPLDLEEKERGGRGVTPHHQKSVVRFASFGRTNNGPSGILERAGRSRLIPRGFGGAPTGLAALGVSGGVSPATPGAQCC